MPASIRIGAGFKEGKTRSPYFAGFEAGGWLSANCWRTLALTRHTKCFILSRGCETARNQGVNMSR
jgi:hypothetical protein